MHHTPVPSSCVRAGWRGLRLFFSGCGLALAVGLLPAVTSESALPRFPLYEREEYALPGEVPGAQP